MKKCVALVCAISLALGNCQVFAEGVVDEIILDDYSEEDEIPVVTEETDQTEGEIEVDVLEETQESVGKDEYEEDCEEGVDFDDLIEDVSEVSYLTYYEDDFIDVNEMKGSMRVNSTKKKLMKVLSSKGFESCYGDQLDSVSREIYDALVEHYVNGLETGMITANFSSSISFNACFVENDDGVYTWDRDNDDEWENIKDTMLVYVQGALDAFLYDYSEVFWAGSGAFSCVPTRFVPEGGGVTAYIDSIKVLFYEKYSGAKSQISLFNSNWNSEYNAVSSLFTTSMSTAEKVKEIHDYIADEANYGITTYSNSAAGFFVYGGEMINCEGYSRAFALLCKKAGIICVLGCGDANGQAHAWDYVKLEDGNWYMVDVTWDDQVDNILEDYLLTGLSERSFTGTISSERTFYNYFSQGNLRSFEQPVLSDVKYHQYSEERKESTCLEEGYYKKVCVLHGEEEQGVVPKSEEHKYEEWVIEVEPTCAEEGLRARTCEVCGETETERIEKSEFHGFGEWAVEVEPTCAEEGLEVRTCEICGETESRKVEKTNTHSYGDWAVKTFPTCLEKGLEVRTCEICGKEDYKEIGETDIHRYNDGVVSKEATEFSEGEKVYTCLDCGKEYTEVIPKLKHTHIYIEEVVSPTCTEQGYTIHVCRGCGDEYKDNYTEELGHDLDEGIITKEDTCAEDGLKVYTCKRCGYTKSEVIKSTGHKYTKEVILPTTESRGYTLYRCSACGDEYKNDFVDKVPQVYSKPSWEWEGVSSVLAVFKSEVDEKIVKLNAVVNEKERVSATCLKEGKVVYEALVEFNGVTYKDEKRVTLPKAVTHKEGNWVVVKSATCKEEGQKVMKCGVCGKVLKAEIIPKLSHKWSSWVTVKQATAVAEGKEKRVCSLCKSEQTRSISKLKPTVSLSNYYLTLKVKQSTTVLKVSNLQNGDYVVGWKSGNTKVAVVTSTGKITGKKVGSTYVTVYLKSGLTASCRVAIQKGTVKTSSLIVSGSGLSGSSLSIKKGKKVTLVVKGYPVTSQQVITYSTSNKSVATVSKGGVIIAKRKGSCKITIKSGSKKKVLNVKVS